MTISAVFLKQLEQLSQHDRQEVETFIGYLKSRPQKEIKQFPLPDLTQRLNKELLKGYVQETIDSLYFSFTDSCEEEVLFHMAGRNRPISFNTEWFIHSYDELLFYEDFPNKIEKLWVKYRPGTNRIDKVAFDSKYITDLGRKEGKKRILVLDNVENVEINKHDKKLSIHESLSDYSFAKNQTA